MGTTGTEVPTAKCVFVQTKVCMFNPDCKANSTLDVPWTFHYVIIAERKPNL